MEMERKKPHVLVFPFPAQGHMIPLLDLSLSLASRGLALTVLSTPGNEYLLRPLLSQGLPIQSLILPLPPTEGLPPDASVGQMRVELMPLLMYSFQGLAGALEKWLLQQRSREEDTFGRVVCIISDFFLGWSQETAAKVGIPRVVFYPSGAFAVSVIASLWKYMPHLGLEGDADEDLVPIPGLPHPLTLAKFQLSRLARSYKSSDPVYESIRHGMNLNLKSWGVLINTFYSLEPLYVDHLRTISGRPVWSVGPLLPPAVLEGGEMERNRNTSPLPLGVLRGSPDPAKEEGGWWEWLNGRRERSVVYVCFGSLMKLSERQNEAIAGGLEESGECFIWVRREAEEGEGGVGEKGVVIRGWAPQLKILSHPSVGGFVTHCGWNSILESIALGIPMIAWPFSADQHSNALLVEELGVGERVCQGQHAVPDRGELARAVRRLVGEGEEGEGMRMRMRAQELRRAAREAVHQGGSSSSNLEDFVASIQTLAHNNL